MTMPKDTKSKLMRANIAAAAARLMAEDGIEDYALAKRKAARQIGAEDTRSLPGNDEIDEALRAYQAIYQDAEQRDRVRLLREIALDAMRALEQFRPYLAGSVLKGTAGRYSDIDLKLFTDDSKGVELFLLNHDIPYEVEQRRNFSGGRERTVSILKCEWDGVPLSLAVHAANDERVRSPTSERASRTAVENLLEAPL